MLEVGSRRFLAGVHFGQHPSSITLPANQRLGSIMQMTLESNLKAEVEIERAAQTNVQSLAVQGRSAVLVELMS
jgi:hypothetical protein